MDAVSPDEERAREQWEALSRWTRIDAEFRRVERRERRRRRRIAAGLLLVRLGLRVAGDVTPDDIAPEDRSAFPLPR
jgi:hypothetical protein